MKKEYLVLVLIIAAVCAYLVFNTPDERHYSLPQISDVNAGDISRIDITTDEEKIRCVEQETGWVLEPGNYKADPDKIQKMVDSIASLTVTALVAEKGSPARYGLDEKNRIEVTALAGSEGVRKFAVGKTASTYNHTFITLDSGNKVYHASGNLQRTFGKSLADLRDKQVMSFDPAAINRVVLKKGDRAMTVFRISTDDSGKSKWQTETGPVPEKGAVESLVSTFSNFECTGFAEQENKTAFKDTQVLLELKFEGKKTYRFTVFRKNDDGVYPALSSESPWPVTLQSRKMDPVVSDADKILGIEGMEPGENDS